MNAPGPDGRRFGISPAAWILGTFLGWTAGFVLAVACVIAVDSLGVSGTQSPLALGMGLGVGALQARLVPPLAGGRRRWIGATTLGLSLPFLIADAARLLAVAVPYSLAAYVALGGALAGVLQGRLLRPSAVERTIWWPAITAVGWLLAGSTVWINEWLPRMRGLPGAARYVAVVLSGGVILGVAGAAAWRLVRRLPSGAT